jgi:GTPase SAR1 family protein
MIAIWGSRESGKTTFIIALYYEIIARQKQNKLWSMFGVDERSEKFVLDGFQLFAQAHEFPQRTDINDLEPVRFLIRRPLNDGLDTGNSVTNWTSKVSGWLQRSLGSDVREDSVEFLDPSGEFFTAPGLLGTDRGIEYRRALTECDGLVCLVDPVRQDGNDYYFPLLYRNFAMLSRLMNGEGNPGPLPVPIAVCITKADQFENALDDPRAFLEQHMGAIDFSVFDTFCKDVRFFATSAIGLKNVEKVGDKVFRPLGPPKPVHVFEPIEWLLSRGASTR